MNTTPYLFQIHDVRKIHKWKGRCLVANEMGLGKGYEALLFLERHPEGLPAIVVCPASLKWNWSREAWEHFSMRSEVLEGEKPGRYLPKSSIIIINYDILHAWVDVLKKIPFKCVIIDECQMIGNRGARRTKAVDKLCKGVPHVLGLSGTPLTNKPAEMYPILHIIRPDIFKYFTEFGNNFCLHKNAPILMDDLIEKPIHEIQIGEYVIGWSNEDGKHRKLSKSKVLDILTKKSELQKVTLTDGTVLICTPDHRWHNGYSIKDKDKEYCVAKTGKVSGVGPGMASKIMKVFRGTVPIYPESEGYMLGYIHGFFRGDGHCTRTYTIKENYFKKTNRCKKTQHKTGCACMDSEPIDRIEKYLKIFEIHHRRWFRSDELYAIDMSTKRAYEFISQETVRNSKEWWAGFLGGIYDAEGSGTLICQYIDVNPITYEMIITALDKFHFQHTKSDKTVAILGGRMEFLRFWNIANPTLRRKLVKQVLSKGGRFGGGVGEGGSCTSVNSPYVETIEPLAGEHTVYTLTTETGNYIAYGCGSKNCSPRKTPWGIKYDGACNLGELNKLLLSECMIRRKKEDVLDELPEKVRSVIPVEVSDRKEYDKAHHDFVSWLRDYKPSKAGNAERAERLTQTTYMKGLVGRLKVPSILQWIKERLSMSDEKLIIFAHHKEVIEKIREKHEHHCVVITGDTPSRERPLLVKKFQTHKKTRLFIGNKAVESGVTLTAATSTAFGELFWTPGTHLQMEGRHHRIGQDKSVNVYYLIARNTIEEKLIKIIHNKQKIICNTLDGGEGMEEFNILALLKEELLK